MEMIPFPVFGLESSDIDRFMAAFKALKTAFDPTFEQDFAFPLTDYFSFKQYYLAEIREAINLHVPGEAFITFWQIGYKSGSGGRSLDVKYQEYQAWGIATLRDDFGHVLIKERSLGDFFINLIQHTEVDFPEDKTWSNRYCVMADDKVKAGLAINASFRAALTDIDIPDLTIEIINHRVLIGNHKQVNPDQSLKMARLLERLGRL